MSEENIFPPLKEQCEVIQSSFTETYNMYDIILDENIREPSYYRQAFHVLRTAKEGDRVNIILNNSGGRIDFNNINDIVRSAQTKQYSIA